MKNEGPQRGSPARYVAGMVSLIGAMVTIPAGFIQMIGALEGWQFAAPKGAQRIRQSDHAMLQPMFQVRTRQVNGKWRAVPVKTFAAGNTAPAAKQFP